MSLAKDTVTKACDIKAETSAAILISTADVNGEVVKVWIPFSQTHSIHRKESPSEGLFSDSIVMSKWIAEKKGLV